MAIQYKRILLKVSGEALSGPKGTGFDEETIASICAGIKAAHDLGAQIGIVVGGGNFWRGRSSGKMERTLADKIGMLATVMNALAVSDKLEQLGVETEVFTSITMPQVAPAFTRKDALKAMADGKIAIFGGGTGIALLLGALSLFLGLLLGLLRLVLELGVQRLALFHGELALLHQIVDDLLALLKALLPQLNAGGQCPNAREKHPAQAFTQIEISHDTSFGYLWFQEYPHPSHNAIGVAWFPL